MARSRLRRILLRFVKLSFFDVIHATHPAMKFLVVLNWTLWSALFISLSYALVVILTERTRGPKAGPGLGIFLLVLGLVFSVATGTSIYWLTQKQSVPGMLLMSLVLVWPVTSMVARPISLACRDWKYAQQKRAEKNLSVS